ncbi:MAG: hypothetical protein ACI4P6_05890 [Candidatus Spyradosoma sp.]
MTIFINSIPSLLFSLLASQILYLVYCEFLSKIKLGDVLINDVASIRRYLLKILFFTLFFYGIYLSVAWMTVDGGLFFYNYVDQFHFWEKSEELAGYETVGKIFEDCFVYRIHIEQEAIYFIFGTLGHFANKFLGGNNIYFQMYWVSFFAILINLTVARLALLFTRKNSAFKWSLLFALASFLIGYSPWLLRDVHIAFLFTFGLLMIFRGITLWGIFLQLLILLCLYQLRYESCFLYLPLLGYYLWFTSKFASAKILFRTCAILGALCMLIGASGFIIDTVLNTGTSYNEWTAGKAMEGGLARYIYQLPLGIRHFFILVYSQMTPFPFYTPILACQTLPQFFLESMNAISPVVWPYIAFFTVYRFSRPNELRTSPLIIRFLLIYTTLFLIANSTNIHFRRLLGVTPIIFLLFLYFMKKSNARTRSNFSFIFCATYIAGLVVYIVLKGGIL